MIISKIQDYFSQISQSISNFILTQLSNYGIEVSVRWTSVLLIFISLLLIWAGIKLTKPILKWGLIVIGILLVIGLAIPW